MKYLSLLLFATVMMFSCGETAPAAEETTEAEPEVTTPEPPPAPENPMLTATLDAVASVGGDLTSLPAEAAVSNIEGWIGKLKTMEGTDAIVADLTTLQAELSTGKIDGKKVSTLLSSLATQTKSLASGTPALATLAGALEAGAKKLEGM